MSCLNVLMATNTKMIVLLFCHCSCCAGYSIHHQVAVLQQSCPPSASLHAPVISKRSGKCPFLYGSPLSWVNVFLQANYLLIELSVVGLLQAYQACFNSVIPPCGTQPGITRYATGITGVLKHITIPC